MENLITITPEKNAKGEDCLKVELTIDGAKILSEMSEKQQPASIHNLYDSTLNGNNKYLFDKENAIYTHQDTVWDGFEITALYESDTNPVDFWLNNPKGAVIYVADYKNKERQKDVTAKLAAGMWAVYCNQKLKDALLETNNRHNTLGVCYEKLVDASKSLNYNNFKQDDNYYEIIKNCLNQMEKELDFCIQKVRLISMISKNDYFSETPVNELYRSFRGINEDENKSKINVTSDVNEEPAKDTQEKGERPHDSQGEGNLRVV